MEVKTQSIQKLEIISESGDTSLTSFAFLSLNHKTPVILSVMSNQKNINFDGSFYLTKDQATRLRDTLNSTLEKIV